MKKEKYTNLTPCIRLSLEPRVVDDLWRVCVLIRTSEYAEWEFSTVVWESDYEDCDRTYANMGGLTEKAADLWLSY